MGNIVQRAVRNPSPHVQTLRELLLPILSPEGINYISLFLDQWHLAVQVVPVTKRTELASMHHAVCTLQDLK